MRNLTDHEQDVLDILADAWNEYAKLPTVHPTDPEEFQFAMNALQNIILARPATEEQRFL